MKILYAIQATGNGHLTRAEEIIPCFKKRAETHILISGLQGEYKLSHPIKYLRQGFGFIFGKKGGIDWGATFKKNNLFKLFNEIWKIDLSEYDLIITDFEPVTAWAAFFQNKYCIGIGNQYALNENPIKSIVPNFNFSKFVLKIYAPVQKKYPIFYRNITHKTSLPIIRKQIRELEPDTQSHYLIYLSAFHPNKIIEMVASFPEQQFYVFSRYIQQKETRGNITFYPIDNEHFLKSLSTCKGVITHAGFGLTSESMFLGKKLFIIPMKDQIEQLINAAYLKNEFNISMAINLKEAKIKLADWINKSASLEVYFPDETQKWVDQMLTDFLLYKTFFLTPEKSLKPVAG
jgi:uncharacterized protein (TIGR00661 family)